MIDPDDRPTRSELSPPPPPERLALYVCGVCELVESVNGSYPRTCHRAGECGRVFAMYELLPESELS